MNPAGKSNICILHEFIQHTERVQPKYEFHDLENAATPYSATVIIRDKDGHDIKYGTGYGPSKKQAKLAAAHETLKILIPDYVNNSSNSNNNNLTTMDKKMSATSITPVPMTVTVEGPSTSGTNSAGHGDRDHGHEKEKVVGDDVPIKVIEYRKTDIKNRKRRRPDDGHGHEDKKCGHEDDDAKEKMSKRRVADNECIKRGVEEVESIKKCSSQDFSSSLGTVELPGHGQVVPPEQSVTGHQESVSVPSITRRVSPSVVDMTNNSRIDSVDEFSLFDNLKITDRTVATFCATAGQYSPYQILVECLKRNHGLGDTDIEFKQKQVVDVDVNDGNESINNKNVNNKKLNKSMAGKNVFTMSAGKHKVEVVSKNKKEGKQVAAQEVLQRIHPQIRTFGSLLRLYGRGSCLTPKEKKEEEQKITELQSAACPNKPNYAILNKLREQMVKLHTFKTMDLLETESVPKANLENVDL